MSFHYEIRLSGAGGQGLILVGKILAEAAAIYDGKNATQSQSYGPEARGGASRSEVILSDGDIDYPKATNIDLLLAMTQEAVDKYTADLNKGGILLVDSGFVKDIPEGNFKAYSLPITDVAENTIGKKLVANIVALGAIERLTGVISEDALIHAIRARVPKGTEDVNLRAFKLGQELVKKE